MEAKFNEIDFDKMKKIEKIKTKLHLKYIKEYLDSLEISKEEKFLICDEIIKILKNEDGKI